VEKLDQIFVSLKAWILALGFWPEALKPIVSAGLSIAPIMALFGTCFAVTTIMERKGLGRFQNRLGPNRVGPFGLLQPIADAIKMLTKEDIVPHSADKLIHFLAPVVLCIPVWLTFSVLPFGRNMSALDLDAGLLFFFALGASSELAVFMAGWSSRNKYAIVGAMRAIAQMISYEIPLVLSTVTVVMIVGSLSLNQIVEAQTAFTYGFIPNWHVLTPWGFAAFIFFMIAATAETNRAPFDLPEAESEIIAGYLTEYSGFKYALFFLGEPWPFRDQRPGGHVVSRRLVRAAAVPEFHPVVDLVFRQVRHAHRDLHLDSRHCAASAHGPTDEALLEVSRAAYVGEPVHYRGVALHWKLAIRRRTGRALADLRCDCLGGLRRHGSRPHGQSLPESDLSLCRVTAHHSSHSLCSPRSRW
jgi:NADH:ubiquinone oxidoreductase subunit H